MRNMTVGTPLEITELAGLLQQVRTEKDFSIGQMATALKMSKATYWRIEQGGAVMHATAWPIVRRMLRWKLSPAQTETLTQLRERLVQ